LSEPIATRRDDPDAVDVRPAGMDHEMEPFVLEIPESFGDHFTELVSAGEPPELHVEHSETVDGRARRQASERETTGGREGPRKKTSPIELLQARQRIASETWRQLV